MKKDLIIKILLLFFTIFFIMLKILSNETNVMKNLIQYSILFIIILSPYILCNKFKCGIPLLTYFLYEIIVLLIYLGEVYDFYYKIFFFDDIIHSLSGIFLVILFFSLLISNYNKNLFLTSLFAFTLSLSVLYMWEIVEYISDLLFDSNMQKYMTESHILLKGREALKDTMNDLCYGSISSILTSIFCYFSVKYNFKRINLLLIRKLK